MNNATQFGLLAIFAAILIGGVWYLAPEKIEVPVVEEKHEISVLLLVDDTLNTTVSVPSGASALHVLQKAAETAPQLMLVTEEYEGLGTLVKSMYGKENGMDNNYWQYEVNGIAPMVGAGAYAVHDGEEIRWSFKASEY